MDPTLEPIKGVLDDILTAWETDRPAGDPPVEVVSKVVELARLLTAGSSATEWETLAARIRRAFGLTATQLGRMLGYGEDTSNRTSTIVPSTDSAIEAIVPPESWFGEYLTYTSESESPAQFHFGAALTAVAGSLGRRPLIGWAAKRTFPNLYTMLIGPTGARKSTAIEMAVRLVKEALPDRLHSVADEGSPQGLAAALYRRSCENGGVSDGIVVASELSVLMGEDKYKIELAKWLTDWYDSKDSWERAIKDGFVLNNLYVNMLGASNIPWLRRLPGSAITGGFFPRSLLFDAPGKRHANVDPKFDPVLREKLMLKLRARLQDVPEGIPLSKEALVEMNKWYLEKIDPQERGEHDDQFGAWLSRKLPTALKVATVWQLADGGPHDSVRKEWFELARDLVDWMDGAVRRVYTQLGVSEEGEVAEAVLRLVRKTGKMTQSQITRKLRNKWRAGKIIDALRTLKMAHMIREEANPVEGVVWRIDE